MKEKILSNHEIFVYRISFFVFSFFALLGQVFAQGGALTPAPPIENPIAANDFKQFLAIVLNIIIQIGTPIVIIAIIFVGFKFVMAQGNESKLKEAKSAFFWVVIGAAIVIGCNVIVAIIESTVEQITPATTSFLLQTFC